VVVILRQQLDYVYIYLDYVIVDYAAPTTLHPIKLSSPLPRIDYHLLSPHPILGGSAMKNHLAYH
jgi:hypothetical protein